MSDALIDLSDAFLDAAQFDDAERALQDALQINRAADKVMQLGYGPRGELHNEERVVRQAIEIYKLSKPPLDPSFINAQYILGWTLQRSERTSETIALLEDVLEVQQQLYDVQRHVRCSDTRQPL